MGAGLAGLACGYELVKAGFKVTIVEKEPQVGGLATTIRTGKFSFDTGPHRWYAKNDEINNWLVNYMKGELIKVPRQTRIYFDNKFFFYPIKLNALFSLKIWDTCLAGIDYSIESLKNIISPKKAVTIEDGYISKFGRRLYEIFFRRYTQKLWGRKCSELSSDWIDQRTRGFNAFDAVKGAIFGKKGVVSFVDEFYYPKNGIGRIAEKLAEDIRMGGGKIFLSASVSRVNCVHQKVSSVDVNVRGKEKKFIGDEVVSSIPLPYLFKVIKPSVPASINNNANLLKYRAEVQVAVFIKKTKLTADTWIYVHPENIPFVRMMEMDNWSSELSPVGTTTYVFEIPCETGDLVWKKSDQEIAHEVIQAFIGEFSLIEDSDVLGFYVHRIENLLPVYSLGYHQPLKKVKDYLKAFTNLQIIGRNGIFRYNNADHSIEMGFAAARNIIFGDKTAFNIDAINIEREYLEEKKTAPENDQFFEDKNVKESNG